MKRVRITLLSDLHYTAALLDPYRNPRGDLNKYFIHFRNHLRNYLEGFNVDTHGHTIEQFENEIVSQCDNRKVRGMWLEMRLLRTKQDSAPGASSVQRQRKASRGAKSPFEIWTSGFLRSPENLFERAALDELREFACRTLPVSPTATATERTFSFTGRIHTHQRSILSQEKVMKLLFTQWNSRVIRTAAGRDMCQMNQFSESQAQPIHNMRIVRIAIDGARKDRARRSGRQLQQLLRNEENAGAVRAHTDSFSRQRYIANSDTQKVSSFTATTASRQNSKSKSRGTGRKRTRVSTVARSRRVASRAEGRAKKVIEPVENELARSQRWFSDTNASVTDYAGTRKGVKIPATSLPAAGPMNLPPVQPPSNTQRANTGLGGFQQQQASMELQPQRQLEAQELIQAQHFQDYRQLQAQKLHAQQLQAQKLQAQQLQAQKLQAQQMQAQQL